MFYQSPKHVIFVTSVTTVLTAQPRRERVSVLCMCTMYVHVWHMHITMYVHVHLCLCVQMCGCEEGVGVTKARGEKRVR